MSDTQVLYSSANGLACTRCGMRFELQPSLLGCPTCRDNGRPGTLAVTYSVEPADADRVAQAHGFWSQHRLLPVVEPRAVVTLGEGETPLLPLERIAAKYSVGPVFGKAEFMNPTQSYKDRTNAIGVSMARQFGFDKICCISSGNHGVSLAAYAAAAGLRALVLLSKTTPLGIIDEVRFYGAEAVVIDPSSGPGSILELVERLHVDHGWFISNRNDPLPTGRRFGNPFGLEGYKTMAFEIWRQLGGKSPDWCLMPVGGGDGIVGLWRGFLELKSLGLTTTVPRMVACQPTAGASLVNARGKFLAQVEPIENARNYCSLPGRRKECRSIAPSCGAIEWDSRGRR